MRWDFSSFSDFKGLNNVEISRQISTISMRLDNLDKVSTVEKISTLKKVGLDTKDIFDLDWSWLSRPSGLVKICMF